MKEVPKSFAPDQLQRRSSIRMVWYLLSSTIILYLVIHIFTTAVIERPLVVLLAVLLIQVMQWLLQPVFSWIAHKFGIAGILLISLFGYACIMWLTFALLPGISDIGFGRVIIVAWVYALLVTLLQWILLTQSDDYFLRTAIRSSRKKLKIVTDIPGFIFVQLDGVSSHVMEWQLNAGNLPNIKRLIDSGEYALTPWRTQIPSTTPASQAGILLGSHEGIPAFRWYERESSELVVANQTAGASLIEARLSTGKGLLADGGVSVGNLFSGDAPKNIMVISKLHGDKSAIRAMSEYSDYFSSPYGFMRTFVLSIGEMIKEVYQARRQRIKEISPRVRRHGSYIFLRAGTNVLLRDLQTTIVLDQMMQGVNSLYVDYLDYDEIAHHAGIARPESLAALSGLDHVVGILTKATAYAPRPYKVVFVSDHGQSQGPTFKQLHDGKTLEEHVAELMGTSEVVAATDPIENQSSARSLLAHGSSGDGLSAGTMKSLNVRYERQKTTASGNTSDQGIVVTGSGNLGNVWIKSYKKRPTKEQIDIDYPDFISNLLDIKGIGLVIMDTKHDGPICIGKSGAIHLKTGKVRGTNPLTVYGKVHYEDLYRAARMSTAPDVQIISGINPSTSEVYAFEELVGNHGGIGGWQADAMLLHPTGLEIPAHLLNDGELVDSETIHKLFTGWMKSAGQRKDL